MARLKGKLTKKATQKLQNTHLFFRFKKIFLLLVIFLLILSATPFVTIMVGDKLLINDRISQAKTLYSIAHILNPINQEVNKRLNVVQVIQEERKGESEETALPVTAIARETQENANKQVLGASIRVPVLMYHYIRVNPNPSDKVGFGLSVTPSDFTAQMDYLSQHGYYPITLDDLNWLFYNPKSLPKKPVVITFDDSYEDAYTAAYPVLKSHNFRAISFVITGFVGQPNYLTWDQISEMKNSGIFFFESHTVHHYWLPSYNNTIITNELTQSKADLQNHTGTVVNWFAYPYGGVNYQVSLLVKKTGYTGAFGTNFGTYQSTYRIYTLPRVRVSGGESLQQFAKNLPGQ